MADMLGLDLSQTRLEELLPQVEGTARGLAELDGLDLESVEPAIVFRPDVD